MAVVASRVCIHYTEISCTGALVLVSAISATRAGEAADAKAWLDRSGQTAGLRTLARRLGVAA
jgi:hypothetical protein